MRILKTFNSEPAIPVSAFAFSEAGTIAEQTCPKDTGPCGLRELGAQLGLVAEICNLPYRRFAIGRAYESSSTLALTDPSSGARAENGRAAECNSAIRQITNLRYANHIRGPMLT